jgi:Tfp pilus assembly protein PilO
MSNNRIVNLLIGLGIVVVLLLGWFFGVSPILEQVNAANVQTDNLHSANSASAARLTNLKKQYENIGPLQEKLAKLQESIPVDADISGFLAEINTLSAAAGVTLTNLTVNDAAEYVAPGSAVAPVTPDPTATAAAPAPGATPAPVTPNPSTGLVAIPIKVIVSGPYPNVMAFMGALQTGTRLLYATKLTVLASTTDPSFSGQIEGNIYALPLPPGVTPLPAPTSTPTPTPTPTVSATPLPATPTPTPTP